MSCWRERLCGSVAQGLFCDDAAPSFTKFLYPTENISCGGGFFPTKRTVPLVKKGESKKNIILPTTSYSVMVVKDDGSAVIYTDSEPLAEEDLRESPPCQKS